MIDAFKKSLNKYGGWGKNQNEVLFLSNASWEVALALPPKERRLFLDFVMGQWQMFMSATFVAPGHYRRSPRDGSINSHDNYIGIAAMCVLLDDSATAREINKAISFRITVNSPQIAIWSFNNRYPNIYDIKGQLFPKDWFFLKLAANEKPSLFDCIYTAGHLLYSTNYNLTRLMLLMIEKKKGILGSIGRWVIEKAAKKAKSKANFIIEMRKYFSRKSLITKAISVSKAKWTLE